MAHYGYWMSRTGRYHRIQEHGRAIIAKPRRYGLDPEFVQNLVGPDGVQYNPQEGDVGSIRHDLYVAAMKNGWVRIRGGSGYWSVQFFGNAKRVVRNLLEKFLPEEAGYAGTVSVNDLSVNRSREMTFQELQEAYDNDEFTDTVGSGSQAKEKAHQRPSSAPSGDAEKITTSAQRDFVDAQGDQGVRDAIRKRLERRAGFATEHIHESVQHAMKEMGIIKS